MSRFISSMIAGVCLSFGLVYDVQADLGFLVLSQGDYAWECKLRVIDAANARVIAETPVGLNAEVGYDAPRSRVAVLTHGKNEQTGIPSTVLTYFSVPELKEIERKSLAAPKNVLITIHPYETCGIITRTGSTGLPGATPASASWATSVPTPPTWRLWRTSAL